MKIKLQMEFGLFHGVHHIMQLLCVLSPGFFWTNGPPQRRASTVKQIDVNLRGHLREMERLLESRGIVQSPSHSTVRGENISNNRFKGDVPNPSKPIQTHPNPSKHPIKMGH
jgi:hypothetical protein